ncbi:MAG: protein kinase domain-containing protein [Pyrinomonadaceae bacterium]
MISQISQENYQHFKEILADALEIPSAGRLEFVKTACAGDENLFSEIESLLATVADGSEFPENFSALSVFQQSINSDKFIGQKISRYLLEREIGRGGMGVVFLATREDFHQQVALKLIKRGMDSDAILERFRREREILAALNHPFIARLTDGGTTGDDLPFFVMEYVEGVAVDEYCKNNDLPEKEILELFRKICEAVSFAHRKLIVHRDLKPSNILVTKEGAPKLLDFGIAKLLNATDGHETQTNQRVLTPAYASPEQIRGAPIDTTSDVYSLGKILSELLTGASSPETNGGKKNSAKRRKNLLPSDVRNILRQALSEDAARRYQSVEKFSEDVRRYLVGLPISVRRLTFGYRAVKFLRRNRIAVAVAALFVLTLIGGLLATLWQWREAQRERQIAEHRLDNLRQVSGEFINQVHNAIENLPGSLPARRMLSKRAVAQLDELAAQSDGNPALQDELAQAYFNSIRLPDMTLAEKNSVSNKEIAIYQKLIAENASNIHYREQMALAEIQLGDITKVRGSVAEGIEFENRGVRLLEQIVKDEPDNAKHLLNLATAYFDLASLYIIKDDAQAAVNTTQKGLAAVEEARKLNSAEPELYDLSEIGRLQWCIEQTLAGNYQAAIMTLREILAEHLIRQANSPNDTRIKYYLWVINRRLAEALEKSGDVRAAAERWQDALSTIENLLAQSPQDFGYHRNSAITHIQYGKLLARQKNSAEAIRHFRRAVELSEPIIEDDSDNAESKADLAAAEGNLGSLLIMTGKTDEGRADLKKAVATFEAIGSINTENAQLKTDYEQSRNWLEAAFRFK